MQRAARKIAIGLSALERASSGDADLNVTLRRQIPFSELFQAMTCRWRFSPKADVQLKYAPVSGHSRRRGELRERCAASSLLP